MSAGSTVFNTSSRAKPKINQLGLLCGWHFAVARLHGEHLLVPDILRPCLELFRDSAKPLAKLHERVPEAMRIEIGQTSRFEGLLVDRADRPGAAPMLPRQPGCHEAAVLAQPDLRLREQRVIITPEQVDAQVLAPVFRNLERVAAHRAKPCRESLAALRLHVPRILMHAALHQIDVLELQAGKRRAACACHQGKGDQRPVAFFNVRHGWDRCENVMHLIERRHRLFPAGLGNPHVLFGQVKIVGIAIGNPALVTGLPCQPDEEGAQG